MSTALNADRVWDIFIVHASRDADRARALYDRIGPGYKVFLDRDALRDGEPWILAIPEVLQSSRVVAVLISPHFNRAHFALDELARAIDMARDHPAAHRVIPILLTDTSDIPYGLRHIQGLSLSTDGGLDGVARRLRAVVDELRGNDPATPPPPPPPVDALHRYPCGPFVDAYLVDPSIIEAYAELYTDPVRASAVVARANASRRRADPSDPTVTLIRTIDVVPAATNPSLQYWHDVFREARLNGPRMLAALLLAVKDTLFPTEARANRQALLDYLPHHGRDGA